MPSAAMDDGSVEDASELRLGGYAVLEGEAYGAIRPRRLSLRGDDQDGGASPNEQSEPGDEESDYAHTADSRINRATSDNPGRQAEPFGGGVQASATVGAGVKDAAAASSGLQSSTNSLARHPAPALPPSESTNTRLIPLKVVFDKEAHIIDASILRKDRF